jgi:hypothetical protein
MTEPTRRTETRYRQKRRQALLLLEASPDPSYAEIADQVGVQYNSTKNWDEIRRTRGPEALLNLRLGRPRLPRWQPRTLRELMCGPPNPPDSINRLEILARMAKCPARYDVARYS